MSHGHFANKCRTCLRVFGGCRCMEPAKTIEWGECPPCRQAAALAAPINPLPEVPMAGFSKYQKFAIGTSQPPAAHGWICELCHGDRFETKGVDYEFRARCARCRGEYRVDMENKLVRLMPTKRDRFRKKPVEVTAHLFNLKDPFVEGMPYGPLQWHCNHAGETHSYTVLRDDRGLHITIPTLEGPMRANLGDWIIFGIKGEPYPCKPDIFELTYEAVP